MKRQIRKQYRNRYVPQTDEEMKESLRRWAMVEAGELSEREYAREEIKKTRERQQRGNQWKPGRHYYNTASQEAIAEMNETARRYGVKF